MNNVCVVGGSGFIGTRLMKRLQRSRAWDSVVVDKNPSASFPKSTRIADVRSLEQLRGAIGPSAAIVNLAAEHRDDVRPKSLYEEVNVGGARNLCTVARERGINRIVFTSTVAVYGFAPLGTDERGSIAPFNEYGRTKFAAEEIFRAWQAAAPQERTLVIVRPTVVFGERNRGNVYNLLRQVSSGSFLMVGSGDNRKSMAYVENVAAFLEFALGFAPGVHTYNYIDKPDLSMNTLVERVRVELGKGASSAMHLPYWAGYGIGKAFDAAALVSGRKFAISSIRVKKFCSNSVFDTSVRQTGFVPPVALEDALRTTIRHEFIEKPTNEPLYYTE